MIVMLHGKYSQNTFTIWHGIFVGNTQYTKLILFLIIIKICLQDSNHSIIAAQIVFFHKFGYI